jgi:acyl-CoA synthetase (AMP-forming)/AMP-acid ligase II
MANALLRDGIGRGARAAILGRNSIEYAEAYLATVCAGACAVPLPAMASAETLKAMLNDSRARILFVDAELGERMGATVDDPGIITVGIGHSDGVGQGLDDWLQGVPDDSPGTSIRASDEFNIIYSSGTTGTPKGIVHSHAVRAVYLNNLGTLFPPGSVNLVVTPFYSNVTALTWLPALAQGATNVIMGKFEAVRSLELIQQHRVTHVVMVPTQLGRILRLENLDDYDLSSLLFKMSAGSPLRVQTKREILERLPGGLLEIYGVTEGGASTILDAGAHPDKLSSVGQASPGTLIKVIDENGAELPPNRDGELVGSNEMMMQGYLNRPGATDQMIWRDAGGKPYYRTGDVGRIDEEGFIYIVGRKKDMIVSGGFNIYPSDLEEVLMRHPDVVDAAVIAVPHEDWGETPLAVVIRDETGAATGEELRDWANQRLGKAQRISAVRLVEELPRNDAGKVLKQQLREPYWRSRSG